ncbi:hypothetical protein HQ529_05435 [Candidatus Woesearchaeota archaeon]|nr:hypothetical protein [Candidatus Woesearchaeota archaeon]
MSNKKSQAALEFLMTYGWAILVVLVVIGALAYFGVLNPTILLPEKCSLQMGLYCKNHIVFDNNQVFLELENGMGKGIILTSLTMTGDLIDCVVLFANGSGCPSTNPWDSCYNSNSGLHLSNGRSVIINMTNTTEIQTNCSTTSKIGKTKADIAMKWYFDDANSLFEHTMNGEVLSNVETG